jgi:hypothetical protein
MRGMVVLGGLARSRNLDRAAHRADACREACHPRRSIPPRARGVGRLARMRGELRCVVRLGVYARL